MRARQKSYCYKQLITRGLFSVTNLVDICLELGKIYSAITRQPTNRIFKCVIVAKLKGTVRQFRGAKAVNAVSDVRRENLISGKNSI